MMGIAPTGNQVRVDGMTISRIEDGKIVEEWEIYDALGMMQQLGAIPSPEEAQAYGGEACNSLLSRHARAGF